MNGQPGNFAITDITRHRGATAISLSFGHMSPVLIFNPRVIHYAFAHQCDRFYIHTFIRFMFKNTKAGGQRFPCLWQPKSSHFKGLYLLSVQYVDLKPRNCAQPPYLFSELNTIHKTNRSFIASRTQKSGQSQFQPFQPFVICCP